jgi:hypothetical protein
LRSYNGITAVGLDFASTTPEYLALQSFFSQSPTPAFAYIGAWAKTAQPGWLHGAILTPAQQLLSLFTAITNGSTQLTIGGTVKTLSAVNFSGATSLNAVAGILSTALASVATAVWNANYSRFDITTTATGSAATITFASPTGSGVDITSLLGLASTQSGSIVQGQALETPLVALQALAAISND